MAASMAQVLDLLDPVSATALIVTLVVFFIPIFIIFPPIPVERSDALRQTHSKLGLRPPQSNLVRQHAPVHGAHPSRPPKVQALYIYPVKSCRGIEVARSKVLPTGLEYDRMYTLALLQEPATPREKQGAETTTPLWEFQTLRQYPLMANIKVDLWLPDPKKVSRQLGFIDTPFLVLRFPWSDGGLRGLLQWGAAKISRGLSGMPEKEFMLPVHFPSQTEINERGYKYADVKVWKDVTSALDLSQELPPELGRYLGVKRPLGIFRMDPAAQRAVFRCAPRLDVAGYQPVVDFHDAYPLHLLNLSSVQALETNVEQDATMGHLDVRRFRANIITTGIDEYDEDTWKIIRLSNGKTLEECCFDVSCRTVRCKLPNVDPATGIRHKAEPDRALRKYRDVDAGAPKMGCLGMQMCPQFPQAEASSARQLQSFIEAGMSVEVLQRGQHRYIKQ